MRRDALFVELRYIALDRVPVTMVRHVGPLAVRIPLTGEHTLSTNVFEGLPHSPYASEEVDECELTRFPLVLERQHLLETIHYIWSRLSFPCNPAAECTRIDLERGSEVSAAVNHEGFIKPLIDTLFFAHSDTPAGIIVALCTRFMARASTTQRTPDFQS